MNTADSKITSALASVVLYRNVVQDPVVSRLNDYLKCDGTDLEKTVCYSDFVSCLYKAGGDLGNHLEDVLRCDDNVYVRILASRKTPETYMERAFLREMDLFTSLTEITPAELLEMKALPVDLPGFANTKRDFTTMIPAALSRASVTGYGIYARYGMFQVDETGHLTPVPSPDPVTIDDLIGYSLERNQVIDNTKALLEGKPAANALLTGDAGTGKSSTIKAVANMFRADGLRLIEMKKEQLPLLSTVMGEISDNPLKFIIFIDDLTFVPDDSSFGSLKAVLEGSASAKTDNAVIYATSNRRHMIRETFSSRDGDDIHRNDTIEEQTSLAARFGLTILFQKPNKMLYLEIVRTLAERKGITMEQNELDIKAEAFALRKGHRSARVAEQFTDSLLAGL